MDLTIRDRRGVVAASHKSTSTADLMAFSRRNVHTKKKTTPEDVAFSNNIKYKLLSGSSFSSRSSFFFYFFNFFVLFHFLMLLDFFYFFFLNSWLCFSSRCSRCNISCKYYSRERQCNKSSNKSRQNLFHG